MRLAALLLAACGRIGFDPVGDAEVVPPDQIALHVLVDGTGAPAADVDVLISTGERAKTDATGTLRITTTQRLRLDIAFPWSNGWRVYSLIDVPPGTAVHVGRALDRDRYKCDVDRLRRGRDVAAL